MKNNKHLDQIIESFKETEQSDKNIIIGLQSKLLKDIDKKIARKWLEYGFKKGYYKKLNNPTPHP